jgi:hypothetical protein
MQYKKFWAVLGFPRERRPSHQLSRMKLFFNEMSRQSALHLVRRLAWPTAVNLLWTIGVSKSIFASVNSGIK